MNGRERFLTALRGGQPDRVPMFETHFCLRFIREALGSAINSPYHNVDDEAKMSRLTGLDMLWTAPVGFTSFASILQHGERYQDEWGTWYGMDESSWPGSWMENTVVNDREEWRHLKFPDPSLPIRTEQARRAVELANGELAVVGAVRGPFSGAWMVAGMVNMGRWLQKEPDLFDDVLREMARWNTQVGLQEIAAGVDAIMIHDDWGMNMGLMVNPDLWRRYVYPHIAEEVETLAATGTPIIMHSDGNLNAIMDEIVGMKISALNPVQRNSSMDAFALKQKYGNRLCLIGNISASQTLPYGTPGDVELQALELLRDVAPGGAFIMAPDHSYHGGIPSANVWQVFETCKKYGAYPLDQDVIRARIEELQAEGRNSQVTISASQPDKAAAAEVAKRPRPRREVG